MIRTLYATLTDETLEIRSIYYDEGTGRTYNRIHHSYESNDVINDNQYKSLKIGDILDEYSDEDMSWGPNESEAYEGYLKELSQISMVLIIPKDISIYNVHKKLVEQGEIL